VDWKDLPPVSPVCRTDFATPIEGIEQGGGSVRALAAPPEAPRSVFRPLAPERSRRKRPVVSARARPPERSRRERPVVSARPRAGTISPGAPCCVYIARPGKAWPEMRLWSRKARSTSVSTAKRVRQTGETGAKRRRLETDAATVPVAHQQTRTSPYDKPARPADAAHKPRSDGTCSQVATQEQKIQST
jgi:hypothetical protein